MATAVDIFFKQIALTGGIPFAITLPKAPHQINADMMTPSQIRDKLSEGLADIESGRVQPAKEAFKRFSEKHENEAI